MSLSMTPKTVSSSSMNLLYVYTVCTSNKLLSFNITSSYILVVAVFLHIQNDPLWDTNIWGNPPATAVWPRFLSILFIYIMIIGLGKWCLHYKCICICTLTNNK